MNLFGIATNNIFNVQRSLLLLNPKLRIQVVGFDDLPKDADVHLVPTTAKFLKVRHQLEELTSKVFVFDTPVLLEYLKPIRVLDVAKKTKTFKYGFHTLTPAILQEALDEKFKKQLVTKEAIDVIPTFLSQTQGSILSHILTFLYSVPKTDRRLKYQRMIYDWFQSEDSVVTLASKLSKKPNKAVTKLTNFLESSLAQNARKALQHIAQEKATKKSVPLDKVAKKFGVDLFDIKYVLKAIRKAANIQDFNEGLGLTEVFHTRQQQKVAHATK